MNAAPHPNGLKSKNIKDTNKAFYGPDNNKRFEYVTTTISFRSKITHQLFYVCLKVIQRLFE